MLRLLHASDLHFGAPSIPEQVAALDAIIAREPLDAVVISGDISQRTRAHEFMLGRAFIARAEQHAPVLIVPGNHDTAWWMDPMGLGAHGAMYARYRKYIRAELEPILSVPGATIVGLNSSHGIQPYSLTLRPRDLSVVGSLREWQFDRAGNAFSRAPAGDLKVLVMHHNLLRGRLSNRWGLANRAHGIEQAAATGADLVLCGHDHEDRVEQVTAGGRRFVVACASTLTDRVRGGGPGSINVISAEGGSMTVTTREWDPRSRAFTVEKVKSYPASRDT